MDITGKKVLLTGGSAGIGRALAFQLQAEGADVTITGRDTQRLAHMRTQGFGAIEVDLSGPEGDYIAGKVDPDLSDACFYANLSAPVRLTAGLLKRLKRRPEAAIVNVTSGLALAPSAAGAVYCATKAGLRSFTCSLRGQLKELPIHVIEALPPMVDTQMTSAYDISKMTPEHCAGEILSAIKSNREEVFVGQVRLLRFVKSISPALARRIMMRF